ncbi:hypothetical protein J2W42_002998 [Rhizobium tibeticum]|nr:hypothetical protein [Rhizobium tibeticum]
MRSPNSTFLKIDRASRRSGPNGETYDRCGDAQASLDCARSQITYALAAIHFRAEATALGNAVASSAEVELDLSVRDIKKSAKRVWSVLGDTHETT